MLDQEPRQPHLVVPVLKFHRSSLAGTGGHRDRRGAPVDISSARRGLHAAYAEEHYSKGEAATIDLKQMLPADKQSPVAAQPSYTTLAPSAQSTSSSAGAKVGGDAPAS